VWTLEQNLVPTEDNRVHLYLKVFTSNISCCCWKGIGWKPLFSSQQQWLPNSNYMSKILTFVHPCQVARPCARYVPRHGSVSADLEHLQPVSSKTFPKRFWSALDIFSSLIARPKSSVLRCLIRCSGVRCLESVPAPGTPDKARSEAGIGGPDASLKRTTPNRRVLLVNRR
jgi:hypothetical protein